MSESVSGLRGIPGIPGWQREALGDFIRHSADLFATEEPSEAVGVFLLRPVSMIEETVAVWEAVYKPLMNVHRDPSRFFEIDETELMHEVANVMDRWEKFFIDARVDMSAVTLYSPILGIGHSHPGGSGEASRPDQEMFKIFREGREKLNSALNATASKPFISQESHWICAFGSFGQQTLLHLAGDGSNRASFTGDFVAAIQ